MRSLDNELHAPTELLLQDGMSVSHATTKGHRFERRGARVIAWSSLGANMSELESMLRRLLTWYHLACSVESLSSAALFPLRAARVCRGTRRLS